ncbi:hypothetical protein [Vibrio chagasii]|uniref:hypothetical protein n=1 Tax=Vibrio chagasii TaxID=170679 RepID=UPI004068BD9D
MFNFKQNALTSLVLIGMATSAGANAADATATVIWSGTVPASNASGAIVITGTGGDLTALHGTINSQSNGVFESDSIVLEAHANDTGNGGTAANPVVGALIQANWTLKDAVVTFDGMVNSAQAVEVNVNGSPLAVGEVVSGETTIRTVVKQTAELPESEVGGTSVQAAVTVMASVV